MIHLRILHFGFLFKHMELGQELVDVSTILLVCEEFLIQLIDQDLDLIVFPDLIFQVIGNGLSVSPIEDGG